jgi:O-antigen ligase
MICGMGMHAIFKHLTPAEQERTAKALTVGMVLAFVLLTLEWMFGRPWLACCNITPAKAYTNASVMLAVFFWPVVSRLSKTYHKVIALVLSLLMLLLADCDASILGLVGASFVVAFWRVLRPYFGPLWVGAMAVAFIIVPVGFNLFLTDLQIVKINEKMRFFSYVHRLYVWQAASQKIKNYHYLGAGMDASRLDSVGGDVKEYYFLRSDNRIDSFRSREIPMHPHNIPLQIWLELGAIGVTLFLALITYVGRLPLSSEMASVIIVMSIAGLVSVGAWQSWFISTLMFAMYFCHFISRHRKAA